MTRKVTHAAAAIKLGQAEVALGNPAREPEDFVTATGETQSVRELVDAAFAHTELVQLMVDAELELLPSGVPQKQAG